MDMERVVYTVDGSEELFRMLAEHLIDDDRAAAEGLGEKLAAGNMESVRREAHRLKSALKSLAAYGAAEAALALEESAEGGQAAEAHRRLLQEMDDIADYYRSGGWKVFFENTGG